MRGRLALLLFGALLPSAAVAQSLPGSLGPGVRASGKVDNDTYHYDTLRSGWNNAESALNTTNVASKSFGRLFSVITDGVAYGQPLIAADVTIPADGLHDLLIAGTNRDLLYAYDANTGKLIWKDNFTGGDVTDVPLSFSGCDNTGDSDGILSTPVVDRKLGAVFVVAATLEGSGKAKAMHYRLHRVHLATGVEFAGSPVDITATYNWSGGSIAFQPRYQYQRPALLEWTPPTGGGHPQIDIAFSGQCDFNGNIYHGWILAYDAYTLAQTAVQNITPAQDSQGNYFGGIWMSGSGPAEDDKGFVYLAVGNGTFDGLTSYGESVLKFPGNLSDAKGSGFQFFTPYTVFQDNAADNDTGSGGIILFPKQRGSYPDVMVMQGKDGVITLLDRDKMGGYVPGGPDNALAELQAGGVWSAPAYYQDSSGNTYLYTTGGTIVTVQIANGTLNVVDAGKIIFGAPNGNGSTPTISSYQSEAGSAIVWIVQRQPLGLYALDAGAIYTTLFSYPLGKWNFPDSNPTFVPTVANGKVYVADASGIVVFGLH